MAEIDPNTYQLSQAEIDAYRAALESGKTAAEIGAQYNLSASDVMTIANNNQLQVPTGNLTNSTYGSLDSPYASTNTNSTFTDTQYKEGRDLIASGETAFTPGSTLTPVKADSSLLTSTQNVIQLKTPDPISAGSAGAGVATATIADDAQLAAAPEPITAQTYQASLAGDTPSVQAAEGAVSPESLAKLEGSYDASLATAQQVSILDGSYMEAASSQIRPEDLAEAATVAGVEVAKITNLKDQLRRVGFTQEQIDAFGNDISAIELELSNYSEEQRGIIAGLPREALVSIQMEQLLVGLAEGEIPLWARPAVSAVEAMLARRGMSVSTVGRDALANVIIQAAMPLAQQNADTIKEAALRQKDYERTVALQEASFRQQAVLQNAQNSFNLNLTNLSNEQQARLANSQFMQTVSITNATHAQQAAIQNAVNLTNMTMAKLSSNTQLAMQNANAFLQMDLTNLSNKQQSAVINAQMLHQTLLSDQAATNAAKQFNAASENQVTMFMAELATNIEQFNAAQTNQMEQFNAAEQNKISAMNAQNATQVSVANAQMMTQVNMFNAEMQANIAQWNAANMQMIEQANIEWRRQANLADTAAQNAINQQNAQNAFNMTLQAQNQVWQELRDEATFAFTAFENDQDRKAQLYASAIGNESAAATNYDQSTHLINLANSFFNGG